MKKTILALAFLLTCNMCLAGAWGPGSFENDDALDWQAQCIESKGSKVIEAALQAALALNVVEAPEGAMAVAAAEVVAASKGKPNKALPPELRQWLARQPKEEIARLAPLARKVLIRLKEREVSELRQLWDAQDDKQWVSAISELQTRLQ